MTKCYKNKLQVCNMETDDFEVDSEICCHNACIVTKNFVTEEDISAYLKCAITRKQFRQHSSVKIYSGAHGTSDGKLSERDVNTIAFYSNVCSFISELQNDPDIQEIVSDMDYKIESPVLVGKSRGITNLRHDHRHIMMRELKDVIKKTASTDFAEPIVIFLAFCWSDRNELTNFMRELGIISVAGMLGRNSIDIKNLGPVFGPVFGPKLGQTFEDVSICFQVVLTYILFNLTSRASFRAIFRAKN